MEIKYTDPFIPKCLEKELKLIEDSDYNYTNIFNVFFNFTTTPNNNINDNSFEQHYKKLIVKDLKIKNFDNFNLNKPSKANEDSLFSMIIPYCSKDFVLKLLKNFHNKINESKHKSFSNKEKNEKEEKGIKENTDQVCCCLQRKMKEESGSANHNNKLNNKIRHAMNNEAPIINEKKLSLMGKLYSKTLSKIFGSSSSEASASDEKNATRVNSIFNKLVKINNINANCDYFHVEINRSNSSNLSAYGKLKSKFISQYKSYELFRYFFDKKSLAASNDKKKPFDLNSNNNNNYSSNYNYNNNFSNNNNNINFINDNESQNHNIQSQLISQNNEETTDDFFNNLNFKQVQASANYFYQNLLKNDINRDYTIVDDNYNNNDNKNPNFSMVFFKFLRKEDKGNYFNFNFNMPFSKQQTHLLQNEPESEFCFVVSLVDCFNKQINRTTNNDTYYNCSFNNRLHNDDKSSNSLVVIDENATNNSRTNENENYSEFNVIRHTKINFAILTKTQVEKIEHNSKNNGEISKLLEHFHSENSKISLFCELIESIKAFILSNFEAANYGNNKPISIEEEEFILQSFISLEQQQYKNLQIQKSSLTGLTGSTDKSHFKNKNEFSPQLKKQAEINKLDLIDINFCRSNDGYDSNRSSGSG